MFINRAYYSKGTERLKWLLVYLISSLHLPCIQSKPFNPILGETYQCKINNLKLYLEHIVHKPPTYRFYGISDNYTMYGYKTIEAVSNLNCIKASDDGSINIRFKDGHEFSINNPSIIVNGITVGKRTYNYRQTCSVIDRVSF